MAAEHAAQIQGHMEVLGSDGEHVGVVDDVVGSRIKLTRTDPAAQGTHHFLHLDMAASVEGGVVRLTRTGAQARDEWGVESVGGGSAGGGSAGGFDLQGLADQASLNPLLTAAGIVAAGFAVGGIVSGLRKMMRDEPYHVPIRFGGEKGRALHKALHIRLEARPGREDDVEALVLDILSCVRHEPDTAPWYGMRFSRSVFEIFETFPNEAARMEHLSGEGAMILTERSNELLAQPAQIDLLDVLAHKPGEPGTVFGQGGQAFARH